MTELPQHAPMNPESQELVLPGKRAKRSGPMTNSEIKALNITLRKSNRELKDAFELANNRLERFAAGGIVPEKKIIEWREKCFQICCEMDKLRDAMRQVLLDVETYPRKEIEDEDEGNPV